MSDALADLKNLGPRSIEMLGAVGIDTPEALREAGSVLAYKVLKHRFPKAVNLLFLYALEGALTERHWNSFSREEKARLQAASQGELDIGLA
ncbi:MAG: TfoX/Sxy family protein [Rhodothermaceae bacterium]|nr:TfoX/Sxy family protein [Rhodothermaceae bacterium]